VLPVDRTLWYPGSRYVKTARPDAEGRFSAGTLPPGEYWLTAVDAFDDALLEDPEVLNAVRVRGRRVTLSAGQRMTTAVTLARLLP
jgi:hypothetical protein